MEIIYWKSSIANFGDELNETYWNKVISQSIHEVKEDEAILGIGSILHFKVAEDYKKIHVLGTGTSQINVPNVERGKYQFWFVRGPLTANLLGLDKNLSISDPAVLIPDLYEVQSAETRRGGIYIPHYASALSGCIDSVCQLAGLRYISPMASLDLIANAISSAEFVVTESLHGAILADAYRVPWIPTASPFISRAAFKWHDWCQSLELSYNPVILPSLTTNNISRSKLYGNSFRKNMATIGIGPKRWLDKQTKIDGLAEIEVYAKCITRAINNSSLNLSASHVINEVKDRMYSVFEDFSEYALKNS